MRQYDDYDIHDLKDGYHRGEDSWRRFVKPRVRIGTFEERVAAVDTSKISQVGDRQFSVLGSQGQTYAVSLVDGTCSCPAYAKDRSFPCKHLVACRQQVDGADAVNAKDIEAARHAVAQAIDPLLSRVGRDGSVFRKTANEIPVGLVWLPGTVKVPSTVRTVPARLNGRFARVVDVCTHLADFGPKSQAVARAALAEAAQYDHGTEIRQAEQLYGAKVVAEHVLSLAKQGNRAESLNLLLACGYFLGVKRSVAEEVHQVAMVTALQLTCGDDHAGHGQGESLMAFASELDGVLSGGSPADPAATVTA